MKKKILSGFVMALMVVSMLAGCGGKTETTEDNNAGTTTEENTGDKLKVSLLVTGSFGDKAFNDSAQEGMEKIKADLSDK